MQSINTIGVVGGEDSDDWVEILNVLASSCGMKIRRARLDESSHFAGFIVMGSSAELADSIPIRDRSSIRIIMSDAMTTTATVCFVASSASPIPFRGRNVPTASAVPDAPPDASEVIATADGKPVWTTALQGDVRHDTCWVSRPWIKKGECAFDHLNGSRFMNLLPLLEWLRWISGWHEWTHPPLRACFMFDDPNLHATRYGFVGYQQLAVEGRRHHYHTAFATVPLDGYYVNRAAARIIQDNQETLSLLIHGNNHTYRELASREPAPEQLAWMQQAMLRTDRLERRAGVSVSRVMAPPHGVCSAEMMAAMSTAGLEALCVSHGSAWTGNQGASWTMSLGAVPFVVVAGLPLIPRFGLDQQTENNVLLAAYLHQPVIQVGHHWDLAEGTDILSSAARRINSLGNVRWGDMTAIARSNYRSKIQGEVMHVQTFSRITIVNVPEGISTLELEAPWVNSAQETMECNSGFASESLQEGATNGWRFRVRPRSMVECAVVQRAPMNGKLSSLPKTPVSVIARKVLVEMRDRSMPYLPRKWVRR